MIGFCMGAFGGVGVKGITDWPGASRGRGSRREESEMAKRKLSESAIAAKRKREELGLSRKALAKIAGVSSATIFNFETGKCNPRPIYLIRISDALNGSKKDGQAVRADWLQSQLRAFLREESIGTLISRGAVHYSVSEESINKLCKNILTVAGVSISEKVQ